MIISHKHKFIFIKTNKTAGTSIEIALSKFCGPDDIITPNEAEDENIRHSLGNRGPQHYLAPLKDYQLIDVYRYIARKRKKDIYYRHISAKELKQSIDSDIWNNYYKFCFERNPWDRVISYYYWRLHKKPKRTISEFIDSERVKDLLDLGYGRYTINDEIVVDRVCLFENLKQEMEYISTKLGFPEVPLLPKAKSAIRKDKRHYREILSPQDRIKIEKLFHKEIKLFNYQY